MCSERMVKQLASGQVAGGCAEEDALDAVQQTVLL